ncbi:MAG: hypothetical protein GY794_19225, partial [bacterium]|nr:hypothetical protein [bacterium]
MDIGWLIAIVFVVLFLIARNKLKVLRACVAHEEYERQRVLTTNRNLVVLRRQFKRMLKDEELDESDFEQLAEKIDACLMSAPKNKLPIMPRDRWWSCCEAGWHTLTALELVPHGPPPWYKETETPEPGVTTHPPASEDIVAEKAEERLTILPPEIPSPLPPDRASVPPEVAKSEKISSVAPVGSTGARREEQAAESGERPVAVTAHAPAKHVKSTAAAREFAWRPVAPGSLERALHAISGWPKILVPFLVQNIGWFIGTFLFLAGSVFLVTYTTGFIKAAIVFASLFAYTLFLIWAGYKLLRLRTRLAAASAVLLSTGMLLVPLTISAVTQLLMNAGSALLLWIVGIAAALSSLVVFYIAAQVVSGVVHRSLRGHYPRLFLAGAAIQLGAPLIAVWPSWQTL